MPDNFVYDKKTGAMINTQPSEVAGKVKLHRLEDKVDEINDQLLRLLLKYDDISHELVRLKMRIEAVHLGKADTKIPGWGDD